MIELEYFKQKNLQDSHNMLPNTKASPVLFYSCKKGELFDYLTEVVTLSEKRTRYVQ